MFGTSYLVAPSVCNEMESSSDEMYQSELNAQRVCNASLWYVYIYIYIPFYCVYVREYGSPIPLICDISNFILNHNVIWFPGNIFVYFFLCKSVVFHLSKLEHNLAVFQEICSSLHSMDQGLVCSSYCNVETMRVTAFHCFYILQPSKNGPMLLKVSVDIPLPPPPLFYWMSIAKQEIIIFFISSACVQMHDNSDFPCLCPFSLSLHNKLLDHYAASCRVRGSLAYTWHQSIHRFFSV